MVALPATLKIYFEFYLLKQKAHWLKTIGSIELTCRSKVAKIIFDWKLKMAPMAAILKIYIELKISWTVKPK